MKIKRFKLNALSAEGLRQKEMDAIVGGRACGCSCYYANSGGSSSYTNSGANYNIGDDGGFSGAGCNQYMTIDGQHLPPLPLLNESTPM